jgi:predicted nuclease of restriction endonuclease-like (RecB) superfamily
MDQPLIPAGYGALLEELKTKIRTARIKLAYAANRGLITLYWNIGRTIVRRQKTEGWGRSVVERLGQDLQKEFPGQKGFSAQNIWHMRSFYLAWDEAILLRIVREFRIPQSPPTKSVILQRSAAELEATTLQLAVGELPDQNLPQAVAAMTWGQNIDLIHKVKDPKDRLWYARQCLEHGWTRDLLVYHIKSSLHKRQGKALTNFQSTLPPSQAERAQEIVVEYALRNSQKPIGVATYTFTKSLPESLRGKLPSAEAIEAALGANPRKG